MVSSLFLPVVVEFIVNKVAMASGEGVSGDCSKTWFKGQLGASYKTLDRNKKIPLDLKLFCSKEYSHSYNPK